MGVYEQIVSREQEGTQRDKTLPRQRVVSFAVLLCPAQTAPDFAAGMLLCATKDHEVVEYALNRAVSPALVAEYQTRLPHKKLLQSKLHEFYELAQAARL